MEPDMFVSMIKSANEKGVPIKKLAGDDDHTGINRVRAETNLQLEKVSDKNHVRKNVTKKFYELSKQHKSLTTKVIQSVTKNFNCLLGQNHGNEEKISTGLKAVVEHMFGNHSYCQDWCGFIKNPDKYKHSSLPYGKDLSDASLHVALSQLFNSLDVHKLAFLSSTQANESFNNTVASKAPKARHCSNSSSLQYRLCASVSQKNEGYSYITDVNVASGLSPGVSAKRKGVSRDRSEETRWYRESSIPFKRRHLRLKAERHCREGASATREGATYVSNIGQEINNPDISQIPSAIDNVTVTDNTTYVTFDLETGGLSRMSDILQISAVQGKLEFSKYITPMQCITREASNVTKLTAVNGLFFDGISVETVTCEEGLHQFIAFLQDIEKPVLVGHNIKTFDLLLLHHHMIKFSL